MEKFTLLVLSIVVLSSFSFAQTLAARISNARVEGDQFLWDVEINRTDDWGSGGGNDILGNCDFYYNINVNGFTTAIPTLSGIHSSLDGNSSYSFSTGRSGGDAECWINLTYDSFGGGTNWYPPLNSWELLFTVSLPIANALENSGLAWHETSTGFSRGNNQPLTAVLSIEGDADIPLTDPSNIYVSQETELPQSFKLHQNFPNPFNPSTQIVFDIPFSVAGTTEVTVIIYNSMGQVVKRLYSGDVTAGKFNLIWDGKSDHGVQMASGIYLTKIMSKDYVHAIKMTLLK